MNKAEILEFITKNPIAYMATLDDEGKPRVRAMGTYKAAEEGIIFSMQTPKDVYKQLKAKPYLEACYFAGGIQVRVCGDVVESTDETLRKEILKARPFLQPGVDQMGMDFIGVFIVKNGKATVLDMSNQEPAGTPKTWIDM